MKLILFYFINFFPAMEKRELANWGRKVKEILQNENGENSQIPHFGKICGKLALFRKYLTIYYFFSTWVSQNQVQWTWVPSESPVWHCWLRICIIKKIIWYSILLKSSFFIVLEFYTIEYPFFIYFLFTFCFIQNFYLGNAHLFSA